MASKKSRNTASRHALTIVIKLGGHLFDFGFVDIETNV